MQAVPITPVPPERLSAALRPDRAELWLTIASSAREVLAERKVLNVSSTAGGGGVAEMLHGFLRYVRGGGIDVRWLVIDGSPAFFDITKRIHNHIHGEPGDGGPLDDPQRRVYEDVLAPSAAELLRLVQPGDIVILHDPQTAGLAPALRRAGARLVWRSHVGTEETNSWTEQAWAFLHPYVVEVDATVFSRRAYVPQWLARSQTTIIAPSIDPLSIKNEPLSPEEVRGILGQVGLMTETVPFPDISLRVSVVREGGLLPADVPVVMQVSRWDRLKDMLGVLRGFLRGDVAAQTGAHLLLVGPDVSSVRDDPEGQGVLAECTEYWRTLTEAQRRSASLVSVPMTDLNQNAAIINALQRHAQVIVQKSLKEGFGLTVSEGMWKGAPLVASAVGGIQDQVRDGIDGLLLPDPTDLLAFSTAVTQLLTDPSKAQRMGESGHARVRDHFLADRDLSDWLTLIERLC